MMDAFICWQFRDWIKLVVTQINTRIINILNKMEKYIFDCRQKLHESPKFLKRNQKLSFLQQPTCQQANSVSLTNYGCNYLKNKVFLTFDYSYYQTIPKTASMHVSNSNRIGSLNSLVGHTNNNAEHKFKSIMTSPSIGETKWKKQKQNGQVIANLQTRKGFGLKKYRKKIKMPVYCMPGVGDYYAQHKNIQKRIIYDVKIRGKPSQSISCPNPPKPQQQSQPQQTMLKQKPKPMTGNKLPVNRMSKTACSFSSGLKERRLQAKIRQNQQQYSKFISPIQVTTVWNKLMEKYRLKGSKFDIYGSNQ